MPPAARPATGLVHDAFFYDREDALLATAVPFVRDGVERGETVLVATGPSPVTALLRALFAEEENVLFPDGSYERPVSVIDGYKRTMDHGLAGDVRGYRSIGPLEVGAGPLPWTEWLRYEAAFDRVFAHYPLRTLCAYDTRRLATEAAAGLRTVHPSLVEDGRRLVNKEYVDPRELVRRPEYTERLDPGRQDPPLLQLDDVTDVRALRIELYPAMIVTELDRSRVDDLVKAVCEVARNALQHGEAPVRVSLWVGTDRLVGTVTDQGPGIADPLLGYARSIGSATTRSLSTRDGLGLWAARQLCDVLDYQHTDDGFTVRLIAMHRPTA